MRAASSAEPQPAAFDVADAKLAAARSPSRADVAVSLRGVTKSFAGVTAVEDVTFDVPRGALFGLLGPNGAGKTTALRLIVGIYEPEDGSVSVLGHPASAAARSQLGYLPEERGLYRKMSVLEQLVYFGRLKGLSRDAARRSASRWLERLQLADWSRRRLEDLSKGMQQKVQFAAAVLHDPPLLILDEPFSGLDPINLELLLELIEELHREGKTILLSTHRLDQADRLVGEICLIHRSRTVLSGNLKRLKEERGRGRVLLETGYDPELLDVPELVTTRRRTPLGTELTLREGVSPQDLLRRAVALGEVRRFQLLEPSLHEIYLSLIRPVEPASLASQSPGNAAPRGEEAG